METLFILLSEVEAFRQLHPEYNDFEEVYDKDYNLVGYNASIIVEE